MTRREVAPSGSHERVVEASRRWFRPSPMPYRIRTTPAATSAHHQPAAAFSTSPNRIAAASKPSTIVTLASALSTRFPRAVPVLALPAASANITAHVAASQAMPSIDVSGRMPRVRVTTDWIPI